MTKRLTLDDFTWHPLAALWPLVEGERFDQLRASIERRMGNTIPILYRVVESADSVPIKQYLDGRNRMRACLELGLQPNERRVIVPDEEVAQFIEDCNDTRRHEDEDTRARRQEVIARLTRAGLSTRTIAEKVGVNQSTVAREQKKARKKAATVSADGEGEVPENLPDVLGRNGKTYSGKKVRDRTSTPKPAPVRAGEELFDWKSWDSLTGEVVRGIKKCEQACKDSGKRDFDDLRKKAVTLLSEALRVAFTDHNGKGAKPPAPRWNRGDK